jgi:hypothetical protein
MFPIAPRVLCHWQSPDVYIYGLLAFLRASPILPSAFCKSLVPASLSLVHAVTISNKTSHASHPSRSVTRSVVLRVTIAASSTRDTSLVLLSRLFSSTIHRSRDLETSMYPEPLLSRLSRQPSCLHTTPPSSYLVCWRDPV